MVSSSYSGFNLRKAEECLQYLSDTAEWLMEHDEFSRYVALIILIHSVTEYDRSMVPLRIGSSSDQFARDTVRCIAPWNLVRKLIQ